MLSCFFLLAGRLVTATFVRVPFYSVITAVVALCTQKCIAGRAWQAFSLPRPRCLLSLAHPVFFRVHKQVHVCSQGRFRPIRREGVTPRRRVQDLGVGIPRAGFSGRVSESQEGVETLWRNVLIDLLPGLASRKRHNNHAVFSKCFGILNICLHRRYTADLAALLQLAITAQEVMY